ncbi:methylated-DNA--[protein]-cysteine S-methyltransferase [Nocardia sp. XZ_19_385]|uniref:methylated-DNA--[protein]-cysteine S-methyltransferase n=1 Tax=Nocardia sp. XZ_19_385 TaxID=2769488 RepID=UPI00188F787C|nr:methylated-DNA--[protein]-cysteine S-methyltransferase [Nocardia sp. XZ_19_385]
MTVYAYVGSPLGELRLAGERVGAGVVLASVAMVDGPVRDRRNEDVEAFEEVAAQLRSYFAGELMRFDLEFADSGTEFQRRVWAALDAIPYGTTVSYGEIAARIGAPRDRVRAVAAAIGANPLLVVRPCHRVIGVNGAMTGYAGGLERKQRLLALEGVLLGV